METLEHVLHVAPHLAFASFTSEVRLAEWLCQDAQVDARPGGRFYAYWAEPSFYAMGEFLELEAPRRLRFDWHDSEGSHTAASIDFHESPEGTRVTLHFEHPIGEKAQGLWQRALQALKTTLEQGYRPDAFEDVFLGLTGITVINSENAALYFSERPQGLFVQGLLHHSPLERAGIARGDVISKIGDQSMNSIPDLLEVLNAAQLYDTLELEIQRGATTHQFQMVLEPRSLPAFPVSLEALALYRQQLQHAPQQAIKDFVSTVNPSEAAYKPTATSWNALQVMAHLINSERDTLTQIAQIEAGRFLRAFTTNAASRIAALLEQYQTLPVLAELLFSAQQETYGLIRHLPSDYLERKFSVTRVQFASDIAAAHLWQHLEQMRRSVALARAAALHSG